MAPTISVGLSWATAGSAIAASAATAARIFNALIPCLLPLGRPRRRPGPASVRDAHHILHQGRLPFHARPLQLSRPPSLSPPRSLVPLPSPPPSLLSPSPAYGRGTG